MSLYDETATNSTIERSEVIFAHAPLVAKRGTRKFTAAVSEQLASVWRAVKGRWAIRHMYELDEHLLNDIGLTRFDVHSAGAVSLLQDPTEQLNRLACEKRSSRRRCR